MSLHARMQVRLDRFDLDVDFGVTAGEVAAILGPSGAGKTTVLRALAGLVPLTSGRVTLDGAVLEDTAARVCVPPERRGLGVMFQDALLFPHMTVLDNVASGLRFTGTSRSVARARAREWLERTGIADLGRAWPAAISGGQAQRAALARALAIEPRLLLLDEPLSALDVTTRVGIRRELRRHLGTFHGVRLLVTHDPIEALALADRLIVLEDGVIVQAGSSLEVTARPRSRYVADFVGVNLLRGTAENDRVTIPDVGTLLVPDAPAGDVFVVVHPRAIALHRSSPSGSPRNVLRGHVVGADDEGTRVRVRIAFPGSLVAEVTRAAAAELEVDRGGEVWVTIKATEIASYPA